MSYKFGSKSETAVNKVRSQGFSIPDDPEFGMPVLPPDITAIHIEDLMVLFGQFESWLSYIEVQLAAAEIDEKQQVTFLEEISAGIQIENKSNVKTVSELKALVLKDDVYTAQQETVNDRYAYRKIVETIYHRLDRAKFLISRELTRRTYTKD